MPKENCTVTVTEFAIYPPPFMTFSTPVKKSFRMRLNRFMSSNILILKPLKKICYSILLQKRLQSINLKKI